MMAEAEGLEPPSGSPRQFSRLVTYQLAYASGEFGIIVRLASKIKQKFRAGQEIGAGRNASRA